MTQERTTYPWVGFIILAAVIIGHCHYSLTVGGLDFSVYRSGAMTIFNNEGFTKELYQIDLHKISDTFWLPFTYPPFAALLFLPFAFIPSWLGISLMLALSFAVAWWIASLSYSYANQRGITIPFQDRLGPKGTIALLTALIVVFFDVTLALACFFGVGALMERFAWLQRIVLLAGGAVVMWIGVGLLREKPVLHAGGEAALTLPKVAARACVVTWCNPQALIDGTMLFGGFRAGNSGGVSAQLILGSSSASFLWFFGVTILISCFSARFSDKVLRGINVVCGLVILVYGARLILRFFQMVL